MSSGLSISHQRSTFHGATHSLELKFEGFCYFMRFCTASEKKPLVPHHSFGVALGSELWVFSLVHGSCFEVGIWRKGHWRWSEVFCSASSLVLGLFNGSDQVW